MPASWLSMRSEVAVEGFVENGGQEHVAVLPAHFITTLLGQRPPGSPGEAEPAEKKGGAADRGDGPEPALPGEA